MVGDKDLKKTPFEEKGIFYGLYEAVVQDNKDPEEAYRLKLKCPLVFGEGISDWASPVGVFSIAGKGIFALPEKGDLVYLSFIAGRVEQPVWQYGNFKRKTAPAGIETREIAIIGENGGKVVVRKDGKIEISKGGESLGEILDTFLNDMKLFRILTPFGEFPFAPASVAKIQETITKLKNLLK